MFLPLGGLSMIHSPGGPFWRPEADRALFEALRSSLDRHIPVIEMECNINEPPFGRACAEKLLQLMSIGPGYRRVSP